MHNQGVTTPEVTLALAEALPVLAHVDTDPAVWDHQVNLGPEGAGMDGSPVPYLRLTDELDASEDETPRFRWWLSDDTGTVDYGSELDESATVEQVVAWAAPLIARHNMR